jgi:hypothetical protein
MTSDELLQGALDGSLRGKVKTLDASSFLGLQESARIIDYITRLLPPATAPYLKEISAKEASQLFNIPSYAFGLIWTENVIPIEDSIRKGSPTLVRIALASLTNKPGQGFVGLSTRAFKILDERLKQEPRFFAKVLYDNRSAHQCIDPKILVGDLLLRCGNNSGLQIPQGILVMLEAEGKRERAVQAALDLYESEMARAIHTHYLEEARSAPEQLSPFNKV